MSRVPPPSPPVVGGVPARHSGEGNKPYAHVVVHSAVIPCEPGRARQLGRWNEDGTTGGSWHYATDPDETIQCSWDRYVCHAAPPNGRKIHIEMADWPVPIPVGRTRRQMQQLRLSWRWIRPRHRRMLDRTARLTAHLLVAGDLPIKFVNADGLKRGEKGWTTHAQVTKAFRQSVHWDPGFWPRFRQSVHWDPGFWPRRRFGRLVEQYAQQIRREAR